MVIVVTLFVAMKSTRRLQKRCHRANIREMTNFRPNACKAETPRRPLAPALPVDRRLSHHGAQLHRRRRSNGKPANARSPIDGSGTAMMLPLLGGLIVDGTPIESYNAGDKPSRFM